MSYTEDGWFLCDDKLPGNRDFNIVTVLDDSGDCSYIYTDIGWYLDSNNSWIVDNEIRNVIAWKPLPEPCHIHKDGEVKLELDKAISVLQNEIQCVKNNSCDRSECKDCELVMEESDILKALNLAIKSIRACRDIKFGSRNLRNSTAEDIVSKYLSE